MFLLNNYHRHHYYFIAVFLENSENDWKIDRLTVAFSLQFTFAFLALALALTPLAFLTSLQFDELWPTFVGVAVKNILAYFLRHDVFYNVLSKKLDTSTIQRPYFGYHARAQWIHIWRPWWDLSGKLYRIIVELAW